MGELRTEEKKMPTRQGGGFLSRRELETIANQVLGEVLPGQPDQDVEAVSLTPCYAIGARKQVGMTVYHYSKMQAAAAIDITNQYRCVGCTYGLDEQNTSAAPVTVAVGSMTLPILDAASVAHAYAGGRVYVWPGAGEFQQYDIVDSGESDGTDVILYLRTPVRVAIAAGTFTSLYRNKYGSVASMATIGTQLAAAVGIPQRYVPAGYYFWLATWGLVNITQGEALNGVGGPGVVCSPIDGAGWKLATSVAAANGWQRIGHMVAEQTAGIDSGIWLEIDP